MFVLTCLCTCIHMPLLCKLCEICMYICLHVCTYIPVHICMCLHVSVITFLYMYLHVSAHMPVRIPNPWPGSVTCFLEWAPSCLMSAVGRISRLLLRTQSRLQSLRVSGFPVTAKGESSYPPTQEGPADVGTHFFTSPRLLAPCWCCGDAMYLLRAWLTPADTHFLFLHHVL